MNWNLINDLLNICKCYFLTGGCILTGKYYQSLQERKIYPDSCSTCTCFNESSVCMKKTCPVLECSSDYQQTTPGECCPHCPPIVTEFVGSTCTHKGITYQVF